MYDLLTVDKAEAFESVQKKPKLDTDTKSDGMCLLFNLSDMSFTPSYTPKGHCKTFHGCFYTCIALNAVCRAAWVFCDSSLCMHAAHLRAYHACMIFSSFKVLSLCITVITCCNHCCPSFAHTTWTVRVLYWNLAWNDHCLLTEPPICVHEIDLLTLNMLQHFNITLSRPKTYHSLIRVENGIYDCYLVSIAKFQTILWRTTVRCLVACLDQPLIV